MKNKKGNQQIEFEFDGTFDKPLSFSNNSSLICLLCPCNSALYPKKILVDGVDINTTEIYISSYHVGSNGSDWNCEITKIPKKMMEFTNKSLYHGQDRLDRVYAIKKTPEKIPFDKTNKEHVETLQNFLQNKITKIEKLNSDVKSMREEIKKELNGSDIDDIINMSDKCKKILETMNASEKIKLIEEQMREVEKRRKDMDEEIAKRKENLEKEIANRNKKMDEEMAHLSDQLSVLKKLKSK